MRLSRFIDSTKSFLSSHSPEILTGLGISSMVTSTILAVKATPKAVQLISEEMTNRSEDNGTGSTVMVVHDLEFKDKFKLVWKEYLPAASFGVSGIIFVICGIVIKNKRSAALATAYAMTEHAFMTYKDKVIETIGEKKEKQIRQSIDQDTINKNPPKTNQVVMVSKNNTLIRDMLSGRYFRGDIDKIRKIVNECNRTITIDNYISLNEFYNYIGLEGVKNGDRIGWNIDTGLIELDFSACIAENDEPCICIDYVRMPKANFDRLF